MRRLSRVWRAAGSCRNPEPQKKENTAASWRQCSYPAFIDRRKQANARSRAHVPSSTPPTHFGPAPLIVWLCNRQTYSWYSSCRKMRTSAISHGAADTHFHDRKIRNMADRNGRFGFNRSSLMLRMPLKLRGNGGIRSRFTHELSLFPPTAYAPSQRGRRRRPLGNAPVGETRHNCGEIGPFVTEMLQHKQVKLGGNRPTAK